jgi:hypothetical protein
MPQIVLTSDMDMALTAVDVDETSARAALQEAIDMRAQLKRTEASLALVLGALTEFREDSADYVMHRLSLELRRLAESPETAAARLGCPPAEIDPYLLQAIAAHLYGSRDETVWTATGRDLVVLH